MAPDPTSGVPRDPRKPDFLSWIIPLSEQDIDFDCGFFCLPNLQAYGI
jgi:hypothetical protein